MKTSNSKWLAYTVIVGLLPLLARVAIWTTTKINMPAIAPGDIIIFGLVLHIANINELERAKSEDTSWRIFHYGISIMFIVLFSVLYALIIVGESNKALLNEPSVLAVTSLAAVISLILSGAILYRLPGED